MKPFALISLVSSLALAEGCASTLRVDNAPVAALDMNRYLGEWYEIARFDHSFERGYDTDKLIWVRQEMYESDVADKVLAAHFPFKISNLRLTMSRRFGIIESF